MPTKKEKEVVETTENVEIPQVEKELPSTPIQKVEPKEKMGLVETISAIRKKIKNVPKNGYNEHFKYYFTKSSDIVAAVHSACDEYNFAILPLGLENQKTEEVKGKYSSRTILFGDMLFKLSAENGESETVKIPCAGEDAGDKRPYKAMTGALKYLLITLFQISDAEMDDPENDKESSQSISKKQVATNTQPQQAVKPKVETINKAQINELLELANKVPKENQDDNFTKTYSSIQEGTIPASKFENAKVFFQLAAKAKQPVTQ